MDIKNLEKKIVVAYEKQIARAILDAQRYHEESYVIEKKGLRDIEGDSFGEYRLEWEECFQVACEVHGLSSNLWLLLSLANRRSNNIQAWAEDVLADKDVHNVLTKDISASQHLEN